MAVSHNSFRIAIYMSARERGCSRLLRLKPTYLCVVADGLRSKNTNRNEDDRMTGGLGLNSRSVGAWEEPTATVKHASAATIQYAQPANAKTSQSVASDKDHRRGVFPQEHQPGEMGCLTSRS